MMNQEQQLEEMQTKSQEMVDNLRKVGSEMNMRSRENENEFSKSGSRKKRGKTAIEWNNSFHGF